MFRQKIRRISTKDFKVTGVFGFQMCNNGSCIAPEDRDFEFKVKGAEAAAVAAADESVVDAQQAEETVDTAAAVVVASTDEAVDSENTAALKEKRSLLVIFLVAVLGGVLTMFTPCVFPMIPMTVNFFMHSGEDKGKNRRQAWFFGFSIVFIFAVLGAVLALIFGPTVRNQDAREMDQQVG